MNVRQAAEYLTCSRQRVHQLLKERRITGKQVNGKWELDRATVVRLKLVDKDVQEPVKPTKRKREEVTWKCSSCKATGQSKPDSVLSAHYVTSPGCRVPSLTLGEA